MSADDLLDIYTSAVITAQMVRTPDAWIAVGEAWDSYFDVLMLSQPDHHRERKAALAQRCRPQARVGQA